MMNERFIAWPFPIEKPEADWDEFDRDLVGYMQQAYLEGFQPRYDGCAIDAESPSGRGAFLIRRGARNGWEVCLRDKANVIHLGPSYGLDDSACVCVRPPFRAVGQFALQWLSGMSLTAILAEYAYVGGSSHGIVLRTTLSAPGQQIEQTLGTDDLSGEVPKWRDLSIAEREEVRRLLSEGMNVGAIKFYRQATGLGLAESKRAVELLLAYNARDPVRPQRKPCPFCGRQLRTAVAQQCVECGADWHARVK
jgi:hypothetical protein